MLGVQWPTAKLHIGRPTPNRSELGERGRRYGVSAPCQEICRVFTANWSVVWVVVHALNLTSRRRCWRASDVKGEEIADLTRRESPLIRDHDCRDLFGKRPRGARHPGSSVFSKSRTDWRVTLSLTSPLISVRAAFSVMR